MRKICITLLSAVLWAISFGSLWAQVNVTLKMDTNQIFIGEQVQLKLKVSAGSDDVVIVPDFPDSVLVEGVEVLGHHRESSATLDGLLWRRIVLPLLTLLFTIYPLWRCR